MSNLLHFPAACWATDNETSTTIERPASASERNTHAAGNHEGNPATAVLSTGTAERTRRIVQIMSNKGRAATNHDPLPDAADVIAVVMLWVARRGRSLDALPRHTRLQLDRLCDTGDPAAILVRDWIACRLPGPIAEALARADQNADEMMDEGRV